MFKTLMTEYDTKIKIKVDKEQISSLISEVRETKLNITTQFDMFKSSLTSLEGRFAGYST